MNGIVERLAELHGTDTTLYLKGGHTFMGYLSTKFYVHTGTVSIRLLDSPETWVMIDPEAIVALIAEPPK